MFILFKISVISFCVVIEYDEVVILRQFPDTSKLIVLLRNRQQEVSHENSRSSQTSFKTVKQALKNHLYIIF